MILGNEAASIPSEETTVTIHKIWNALPPDQKQRITADLAKRYKSTKPGEWPSAEIAAAVHFREITVRHTRVEGLAQLIRQAAGRLSHPTLRDVLADYHIHCRSKLLSEAYDALGVKHDGATLPDDAPPESPDEKKTVGNLRDLCARYAIDDLWLCFAVMQFTCEEGWLAAVQAAERFLSDQRDAARPEAG